MALHRARAAPPPPSAGVDPLAEPLHRCALHLLRFVRHADDASGLSAARLSALSVLVFGGPCTLGELAKAERVSGPTMTKLVRGLERGAWVRRTPAPHDRRVSLVIATPKAARKLTAGRLRRLQLLSRSLPAKGTPRHKALAEAMPALESVVASLARAASAGSRKRLAKKPTPRQGRRRID
ncbi:MAG: MarR family transcriptional regulator [Gemmatimonadales bacterium]|nr:MarR family transcriptional regulator [Gemmatimonadales bacterium]